MSSSSCQTSRCELCWIQTVCSATSIAKGKGRCCTCTTVQRTYKQVQGWGTFLLSQMCFKRRKTKMAKQPLHPSVRPLLAPDYVDFHDKSLQFMDRVELKPWSPALRDQPSAIDNADRNTVVIGRTREIDLEGGRYRIRVYSPDEQLVAKPCAGWPAILWMHGGMTLILPLLKRVHDRKPVSLGTIGLTKDNRRLGNG